MLHIFCIRNKDLKKIFTHSPIPYFSKDPPLLFVTYLKIMKDYKYEYEFLRENKIIFKNS